MPNVKGSNVLSAVKMLRAHKERAVALLPPQFHHYLTERILPSSWYPETDQIEILRAVAFMLPGTPDPWMVMGRMAAQNDLSDIYRHVVRTDLKDTLRGATSLWKTFHDTGELKITLEAPNQALSVLSGYVAPAREMCRCVGGYVTEVTSRGGARDIKTVKLGCTFDGAPHCSWRMTWSA
jgi:hypothetical protein